MKRMSNTLQSLLASAVLLGCSLLPALGQNAAKDSTAQKAASSMPTDVNAILTNSCARCHGDNGRARPALDLTKWEQYTAEMKASKAKEIIATIENGSMPPKGYLNANPSAAVLKDQLDLLRKWSDSFTTKKKK